MPAAPLIVAVAVGSGVAATIGTAVVGAVVAGTVSTAVATAVGTGIIAGGITAIQGGSVSQVLKSAVIGGVTSGVGAYIGGAVAGAVSDAASSAGYTTIAKTLGTIAGQAVTGGVTSGLTAAAYGQDPVKALIKGGLTAGLSAGVMEAVNYGTSKIDGFEKLPDPVQRATKSALAAGALGKDPEKAALNSFLASGSRYLGSQLKDLGGELKASYDAAQSKGAALESNAARQTAIVDEYKKTADSLNADYDRVQTLTKTANDAIAAFNEVKDDGEVEQVTKNRLADAANAKIKEANDFIASYDKRYTEGKGTLDALSTELEGLKAAIPTLEKDFNDSKVALQNTTKLFNEQEAKNADVLANTVKNLEVASTTVKNDLGIDLGEDQIKSFVESGDVLNAAQAYVASTNKASQDLGFENYKDQVAAAENDFTPEQAADWNKYKDTSGVVAGIAPGVETTGLGGQTDIANVFKSAEFPAISPEGSYAQMGEGEIYGPTLPADQQVAEAQPDFYSPTAPLAQATPSGVQTTPFAYTADQLYQDMPFDISGDLASYLPEPAQSEVAGATPEPAVEPDISTAIASASEGQPQTLAELLGTTPADATQAQPTAETTQVAEATPTPTATPAADSDAMVRLLNDYYQQGSQTNYPGIQLAAYSPTGTMSDAGYGDIGLRSLIDRAQQSPTQPGALSPLDVGDITQNRFEPTEFDMDLSALTPGSATYSALTGADPTKTITSDVLGEDKGDVRGGIESSALYSGAEDEFAPSGTLTEKYLSEPKKGEGTPEDVGLTTRSASGPAAGYIPSTPRPTDQIVRESSVNPTLDTLEEFLAPLRLGASSQQGGSSAATPYPVSDVPEPIRTTLPVSSEAPQTGDALKGNNMEDDDFEAAWQNALTEYTRAPDVPNTSGYPVQDLGISPENLKVLDDPNYGSNQGNKVTIGSDVYTIMPDGSAIGVNTETGEQFGVTAEQMQAMMSGTGFAPGQSAGLRGTPTVLKGTTPPSILDRIARGVTNQFEKDPLKFLTVAGGALAGAASKQTGIQPRGLQSLAGLSGVAGGGAGRVQTGAVGTKGRGGVRFFERKAEGGAIKGGLGYLKSAHDGMADKINATIDNKRPAKLSGGEFVIPADVVSHLGNGNSEAGAKQLYDLMERVRKARTGTPAQGKQINPKKYLPK